MLQHTLSKKVDDQFIPRNVTLLSVRSEIFKLTVMKVDHKDHFPAFQIDFVQALTRHGIPAAAVLAVEMLHQEQYPASASANAYPLHRSELIQKLSVFVACLGAVRSDATGFQSCDRDRKFFNRFLDIILGPGPAATRDQQDLRSDSDSNSNMISDPMFGALPLHAGSDSDFLRWLEGEWDQDSRINFS